MNFKNNPEASLCYSAKAKIMKCGLKNCSLSLTVRICYTPCHYPKVLVPACSFLLISMKMYTEHINTALNNAALNEHDGVWR